MSKELLKCENIEYSTPDGRLLSKDINFNLCAGEMLVICGPNGVGKTTLLQVVLNQYQYYKGKVISEVHPEGIAYLPQLQNVSFHLPVTLHDILSVYHHEDNIDDKVKKIGLLDKSHLELNWNTASGGERKRTLLTRTLLKKPQVLILDEPFNHLDQNSKQVVGQALADFLLEDIGNRGIIIVSHEHKYHIEMAKSGIAVKDIQLGKADA